MLPHPKTHDEYLEHLSSHLSKPDISIPLRHAHIANLLRGADLSALSKIVKPLYSDRGRPARDPTDMLRSLLAMVLCEFTSIDAWVSAMRSFPYYAIISGFDPSDIPGVGTLFEFVNRIAEQKKRPRAFARARPHRKTDVSPNYGIVERIAKAIEAGRVFSIGILEQIFHELFVKRSIESGLIDPSCLYLAGDGTKIKTHASGHAKKVCKCDGKCDCPRLYNDVDASWGYDSYHGTWVYGYSLYVLSSYHLEDSFELPVSLMLGGATRHDSILGLLALHRASDLLKLPIRVVSLDSAHDALPIYRLCHERFGISPIIDLNERNLKYGLLEVTPLGIPICPAGYPMYYWGHCPDRGRLKYRCPAKTTKGGRESISCPFDLKCSPSTYGRTVYTYPKSNYRLFTSIPRGSPAWQAHYAKRTSVERCHKRVKLDFGLSLTRTTGKRRWLFRAILAAMCMHMEAWVKAKSTTEELHRVA